MEALENQKSCQTKHRLAYLLDLIIQTFFDHNAPEDLDLVHKKSLFQNQIIGGIVVKEILMVEIFFWKIRILQSELL